MEVTATLSHIYMYIFFILSIWSIQSIRKLIFHFQKYKGIWTSNPSHEFQDWPEKKILPWDRSQVHKLSIEP
jgi:hypothetical protein